MKERRIEETERPRRVRERERERVKRKIREWRE